VLMDIMWGTISAPRSVRNALILTIKDLCVSNAWIMQDRLGLIAIDLIKINVLFIFAYFFICMLFSQWLIKIIRTKLLIVFD
jgi:hypothetical protein